MTAFKFAHVPAVSAAIKTLRLDPDVLNRIEEPLARNRKYGVHIYSFGGQQFIIYKNVFSPVLFKEAGLFAGRLGEGDVDLKDKDMLEVGCGSGFVGLYLLKRCGLKSLVATDINEAALECTCLNSFNMGLPQVTVIRSDVFDNLPEGRKYDVIFWNSPWEVPPSDFAYRDALDLGVFDRGYAGLDKYVRGFGALLNENGRAFLGFGESGDEVALHKMAKAYGVELAVLKKFSGEYNFGSPFALYELSVR